MLNQRTPWSFATSSFQCFYSIPWSPGQDVHSPTSSNGAIAVDGYQLCTATFSGARDGLFRAGCRFTDSNRGQRALGAVDGDVLFVKSHRWCSSGVTCWLSSRTQGLLCSAAAVLSGLSSSPLLAPWLGRPGEVPWEDAHACYGAVALVACCLLCHDWSCMTDGSTGTARVVPHALRRVVSHLCCCLQQQVEASAVRKFVQP